METRTQRMYRLNINGFKDKKLKRSMIMNKLIWSRNALLKALPPEELLEEVGYYD